MEEMEKLELYSCEELIEFIRNKIIKENAQWNNLSIQEHNETIDFLYYKFLKIYNQLNSLRISQGFILYSAHSFEIPINFLYDYGTSKYQHIDERKLPFIIKDDINKIQYEINYKSDEYTMLMLNLNKTLHDTKQHILDDCGYLVCRILDENPEDFRNSFKLNDLFDICTLKITSITSTTLENFQQLTDAFIFQIIFTFNIPCEYYSSVLQLFNRNYLKPEEQNLNTLSPPQRIYKEHIIDYYSLALSSNEPFAQYLSYYHILEYFFDEVFNENLRKEFQNKITHPNFSYKDNDNLNEIIKFIKDETRNCRENGQGNELESLKLVLKKFINRGELQERLSPEQIEYYLKNKISFSHAPIISFKDTEGFYNHLAQRIYQTRNALVHSKEGNVGRYKPYQDSEELNKEIPLIKLVAEQVIINSSTPL
ncbi:methylamine utilization protein MauJ [Commensalibacter communis]|uniref:methylamine utilization protein MauJ n=1 Tax=Commensalibacter communis TaxID=2972786 RepID=UPI0022FF5207|nr:methylamine utilization protein MauJ [Commensalibacter communis]CAI3933835.1 unnamed protein product [Commensalibacter communis]CAI3944355.1 unnamed protein product [Commensalibacter communis]